MVEPAQPGSTYKHREWSQANAQRWRQSSTCQPRTHLGLGLQVILGQQSVSTRHPGAGSGLERAVVTPGVAQAAVAEAEHVEHVAVALRLVHAEGDADVALRAARLPPDDHLLAADHGDARGRRALGVRAKNDATC